MKFLLKIWAKIIGGQVFTCPSCNYSFVDRLKGPYSVSLRASFCPRCKHAFYHQLMAPVFKEEKKND